MRIEEPGQPPKPNSNAGPEAGKGKSTFDAFLKHKAGGNVAGGDGTDSPTDGPVPYPGASLPTRNADAGSEPTGDHGQKGERDPREGKDTDEVERTGEADRGRETETRMAETPVERPGEIRVPLMRPGETVRGASGGAGLRIPTDVYHRLVESVRLLKHDTGAKELNVALRAQGFEGMNLRVVSHQGQVTTTFVVDSLAQQRVLEAQLPELRSRLEAQGVQVAEVRVELRPGTQSAMGGDAGGSGDERRGRSAGELGEGADHPDGRELPDATGTRQTDGEERTDYTL